MSKLVPSIDDHWLLILMHRERYLRELEAGFGIPRPPPTYITFRRPTIFKSMERKP